MFNRYIAQENDYDCSPTALINARQFVRYNKLGYNTIAADMLCKTDSEGTSDEDLEFAVKTWNLKPINARFIPIGSPLVKNFIEAGRGVILGHREIWEDEPDWHHSFWFKCIKIFKWKFYIGANVVAGTRWSFVGEKYFDRICTEGDEDGPVLAMIIPKPKEK